MVLACLNPRVRGVLAGAAIAAPAFLLALGPAWADDAVSPDGIWYTKGEESIIKVHPCVDEADQFCGTIVWLKEPLEKDGSPKLDKYNKDPAKQTRPIIGADILLGMTADADHWKGHAYNPEDGKLYDITFKVKTDKEPNDTADLRGCVLGFLCQTEVFTRAAEVPGGDPTAVADASAKKHKKKDLKASAKR